MAECDDVGMLPAVTSEAVHRRDEEWANALTHAAGLALAMVGGVAVVWRAVQYGTTAQIAACVAYAILLLATYAASTLSHVCRSPARRHAMRTADQAMIFLFIAVSWTPMAVTWMTGAYWWMLHVALWTVAIIGFTQKAIFSHRVDHGSVSTWLYVLEGFLPLVAIRPLIAVLPPGLLACLLAGGLFFAAGLIFFRLDHRVRYFHALWHILVIAGTASHYLGILLYCTGKP
jgi:hemolysin III